MQRANSRIWPVVAMVSVLVIGLGTLVGAGPETDQAKKSWPFEVSLPGQTTKAIDRLKEIHEKALGALPTATPEERPQIIRVLRASFQCAAFDGMQKEAVPPRAHQRLHVVAAEKVKMAWAELNHPASLPEHPTPWADWTKCAGNLEHGHDED